MAEGIGGTGLPLLRTGDVRTEPGNVIDIDRYTSAQDWARIAQAGDRLAKAAGDEVLYQRHQEQVGYLADQDTEIARKRIDLRDQFANDPPGFDAAWKGYTDGKLGEAAPWAVPHLRRMLGSEGNGAYSAILSERRAQDQRLSSQKIAALADLSANEVIGSAMAGTLQTPEGAAKIEKYRGVLQSAVTANLHPQEWADLHLDDTLSKAAGEEAARSGVQVYRAQGFDAAVDHLRKSILENENLSLKGESRYRAFNRGVAAIRLEKQQDAQDKAGIVADSRDLVARIKSGQAYDAGEVRDMSAALARAGALAAHRDLIVSDAVQQGTRGASLPELAAAAFGARATAANYMTGPPPGAGAMVPVKTPGGLSLNVNPQAAPYFQGFLTDLEAAGAPIRNVGSFNERKIAGTDQWSQHAYGNAIDINQSGRNVTTPDFRAWGLQNRDKLDAIERKWGMIGGQNFANPDWGHWEWGGPRALPAVAGAGEPESGTQAAAAPPPYSGEIARRVQDELVKNAKSAWPQVRSLIERGQPVDLPDLAAMRDAAMLSGDRKWQQDVESGAMAARLGVDIAKLPEAQRQAALDQVRSELQASGLPAVAQDLIQRSLTEQFNRLNKAVHEDQVGYAIEKGAAPPIPLNVANSAAFRTGLLQRASLVRGIAADQGVAPGSALRPAELTAVQNALSATNDPAEKARIFADLTAGIPDERTRMATFAKLGAGGPAAMLDAFAGALYREAPDTATSILRGGEAIKRDKRYLPSKQADLDEAIDKHLPASIFPLAERASPTSGYATMRTAVLNRYADLSLQANDVSGDLKGERMLQAINDVTGGVVTLNGKALIAPERGQTQTQFDAVIWGLSDADLAGSGVATQNGTPITAQYLRQNGKLESIGDGRYLIQLGNDPLKPIYAFKFDETGEPSLFELDLRGRRPRATPPSIGEKATGINLDRDTLRSLGVPFLLSEPGVLGGAVSDVRDRLSLDALSGVGDFLAGAISTPAEAAPRIPRKGGGGFGEGIHWARPGAGWTAAREATFREMADRGVHSTQEIVEKTGIPEDVIRDRMTRRQLAEASFGDKDNAADNPIVRLYLRRQSVFAGSQPVEESVAVKAEGGVTRRVYKQDFIEFVERLPSWEIADLRMRLPEATYDKWVTANARQSQIDAGVLKPEAPVAAEPAAPARAERMPQLRKSDIAAGPQQWTDRKIEIYEHLAQQGRTAPEIAERAGLDEQLVRERLARRELAIASIYSTDEQNALMAAFRGVMKIKGQGRAWVKELIEFAESLPPETFNRMIGDISENDPEAYRRFIAAGKRGAQ